TAWSPADRRIPGRGLLASRDLLPGVVEERVTLGQETGSRKVGRKGDERALPVPPGWMRSRIGADKPRLPRPADVTPGRASSSRRRAEYCAARAGGAMPRAGARRDV